MGPLFGMNTCQNHISRKRSHIEALSGYFQRVPGGGGGWGVGIYSGERLKPSGSLAFPYAHWWESSSLGIDANKDGDIFLGIACPSWKRFNLFPGNNCIWTMLKLLSSFVHVPDEVRCETVVGNQLKQF